MAESVHSNCVPQTCNGYITFHEKYQHILSSGKKAREKDAPTNDKFLQFKVEADKLFDIFSCKCKSNHRGCEKLEWTPSAIKTQFV